jgi:folate-binding protein YgfZ
MRADGVALLPTASWRRLEVLSGVARINANNQELFVPQMVNFELVDGVNFKKGCYPGQEIVARSQYLGKLKRRMFLGMGHGAVPAPGTDVHADGQAAAQHVQREPELAPQRAPEPVGQVVLAAPLADGERFVVLFESKTAAVPAQTAVPAETGLRIGSGTLQRLPLPYALPANDNPGAR